MNKKRLLYYEAFIAIILSFIGGIFDVYCLFNFNIYAMLHTGNIIKLVTNLIDGDIAMFLATLFIVLAFAVGIFLANVYEHHRKDKSNKGLLIISMAILLCAAVVPNDSAPGVLSPLKMVASVLLGFEGAFLVHSFIRFGNYPFSATTMTADINRFVTGIYKRITTKDKKQNYGILVYLLIIAFFILGVGIGYVYLRLLPTFGEGFMKLYGYNLLLLLPLFCMIVLLTVPEPKSDES